MTWEEYQSLIRKSEREFAKKKVEIATKYTVGKEKFKLGDIVCDPNTPNSGKVTIRVDKIRTIILHGMPEVLYRGDELNDNFEPTGKRSNVWGRNLSLVVREIPKIRYSVSWKEVLSEYKRGLTTYFATQEEAQEQVREYFKQTMERFINKGYVIYLNDSNIDQYQFSYITHIDEFATIAKQFYNYQNRGEGWYSVLDGACIDTREQVDGSGFYGFRNASEGVVVYMTRMEEKDEEA